MANIYENPLSFNVQGDGASTTALIDLNFVPATVTFISASDNVTGDVTANIASVILSGTTVTVNFVAPFTSLVAILLSFTYPTTLSVSGTVAISGGVVIAGVVSVSNFPATQPISGSVTITGSVSVTGTFWQATQPVSIASPVAVTGSFFQATQPISGAVSFTAPQHVILDNASIAVTGTFFQATQPVSIAGSVAVTGTFFQATQPISGAISFTAPQHVINDASAAVIGHVVTDTGSTTVVTGSVAVTGTFFQATQPVSIAATLSTDVTDRAARLLGHVTVDNASIAVTGTFFQATQPISAAALPLPTGAATSAKQPVLGTAGTASADVITIQGIAGMTAVKVDGSGVTQPISGAISFTAPQHVINDASAAVIGHVIMDTGSTTVVTGSVAVTGTFFQATQPVSIAAAVDVSDRAARLLGHVTVDNASIAVTGSFFQATQPISAAALPLPAGAATSAKQPALGTAGTPSADVITVQGVTGGTALAVSLGNSVGKTNVMKTGTLTTTAVTADQVILTYTVTALKTFYLEYFNITPRLTVAPGNSNPVNLGIASLESPSGTKLITLSFVGALAEHDTITFTEPVPIAAGTVIRVVCTPDAATSTQWLANFGGYEK